MLRATESSPYSRPQNPTTKPSFRYKEAAVHGYIRVIDESGEDYPYSTERFYPIALPQAVEQTLLFASEKLAV